VLQRAARGRQRSRGPDGPALPADGYYQGMLSTADRASRLVKVMVDSRRVVILCGTPPPA